VAMGGDGMWSMFDDGFAVKSLPQNRIIL